MGTLEGKVAFVSGAGRGQGRSHAVRLAHEGANVIAVDVPGNIDTVAYPMATAADLDETVREVRKTERQIVAVHCDVRDTAALEQAVAKGIAEFGRIDIVVANAGIGGAVPIEDLTDDKWNNMIDVNLTGVFKVVRACVPYIRAGGRGGSVILTSSSVAAKVYPNLAHYAAAKWGVSGLMRALAVELAADDIRVNSVQPTAVNTDLIHNAETYALFRPDLVDPSREDVAGSFRGLHLLNVEWLEPADISNAVAFLASDQARYITGLAMSVDAGAALR